MIEAQIPVKRDGSRPGSQVTGPPAAEPESRRAGVTPNPESWVRVSPNVLTDHRVPRVGFEPTLDGF